MSEREIAADDEEWRRSEAVRTGIGWRKSSNAAGTRREFCERNHMPMTTLDYWRWKKTQASKPRLVEVAVEAEQPSPGFAVVLRNGRRIESTWAFQEPELSRLIRLLESA